MLVNASKMLGGSSEAAGRYRRQARASFGQPSNQKLRSLPEAAAGGSRQQPEAAGKSFEAAGKSFEASGKSFEAAGKSFEAPGKSFEVQASGRGQRQARASFSWPGISFFSIAHACCLQLLPAASKLLPEAAASEAAGKSSEAAGRSCRQELNSAGRHEATTLAPSL